MSYTPTTWAAGDTVTAAKLNKLEQGVASGGGVLVVHIDNETGALDKTWKEINDADFAVIVSRADGICEYVSGFLIPSGPVTKYYIFSVASYTTLSSDPKGDVFVNRYVCDTQNDYPVVSS